jgi:thioredoxin reductase
MSQSTGSAESAVLDVVIAGGGPAGLVAARYCLHARLTTALVAPELGGKVTAPFAIRGVEPDGTDWGAQLVHEFASAVAGASGLTHIEQQATRIQRDDSGDFAVALSDGSQLQAHSVIVATGAAPQRLYVAGEKEFWGRGLSFSAISHAPFFQDRDVAVIGGGQRTLVAALELARIAHRVYLILARPQAMAELPAGEQVRQQRNVRPFVNWEVQEVQGDDFVTALGLVGANGETRQLPVEGIFIEFGLLPNNELVRGLVTLDEDGHILVNQRCETNVPGLFAAGDVTNIQSEQVLVAIGEGAKAALSAWEYLATHRH